jgi:molecular chaperone HscB
VYEITLGKELSYFTIFDFKTSLDIDQNMLETKFSELINVMHPDRFIYKTEHEKLIAEINTSTIHKAYAVLSSELGICEYILNHTENADNNEILDDDAFLMEKMELYEELNNINSLTKCNEFSNRLNAIYSSRLSCLKHNITQKNFHNQNKALQKLKFIQNLIDVLEKKVYMLEIDTKLQ